MADTFGRFAALPIGPLLAARDGGLTLATTDAADLNRMARSDVSQSAGTVGVEFALWGEDDLVAVVGLVNEGASLAGYPGADNNGLGWNLATGWVMRNGAPLTTGLPAVAKGDMVGVEVVIGDTSRVRLYLNGTMVLQRDVVLPGPLFFAASLAATEAGGLCMAVNGGQWAARSAAAAAGWPAEVVAAGHARIADVDWLSAPGDTPANARYEGLLAEGVSLVSEISFWAWGGDSITQTAAATCMVHDAAGQLDALALAGASGLAVSLRSVDAGDMLADSAPLFRFSLDSIEINDDGTKTLNFRDAHDYLDGTINRGVFLPNIETLAWKPQPVVIGAVASVPAAGANSDATAMFVADGALFVDLVMDRGDPMEPGTFTLSPDGQQLIMKSPPVTPVVADVSSVGAGQQPATLQVAVQDVMNRLAKSAWSASDCAAIDVASGYAGIGYYAGNAITGRDALNAILPSYGAAAYQDPDGVLRFARVVAPEDYTSQLAFVLDGDELAEDLLCVPDEAPNLTRRMAYRPNAQALADADLVTDVVDVPQWRRDELTALYRAQVYGAGPLHPSYRRADAADPVIALFWNKEDAQQEIDRVVGIYRQQRFFYQLTVRGDQSLAPMPGQVGHITYSRYGLAAGKQVLVRRVERNPATGDVVLTVWG
ncbi:hypothetical protein ABK045_20155 [Stenotrophomonas pavanii]|uniref:hypothetical protein n=1 Tax=Stenotrophomonas TaxID=40323 RepID=UPI0021C972C2|nr:hypothetical protein [Stenotrophomonas sp. Sm5341]MCU1123525.1 hypothetical protein [Stenotrophomonas maltophilia]MDQ7286969.1 hypothetical protein [Stenotrophomonas sp. Sm5341]